MLRSIFICLCFLFIVKVPAQNSSADKQLWQNKTHNYTDDDSNWKWGIFYYCPQDITMFPPKRSGLGWTVNFGNPQAVGISVIVLAGAIFIPMYFKRSARGKSNSAV